MPERIYVLGGEDDLTAMTEEPFSTEDALQALIAEHPELLAGEQINPADPPRWILVRREKGIDDTPDADPSRWARWAVDHLLIDQHAVPTLVEVKRRDNRELRRTIVGQMLEYAAHASHSWTADDLRRVFEENAELRGDSPDALLAGLLDEEEPDADNFWEEVATHLAAKRLRLLFVADDMPDELARVVEFLNEQMPNIEVLAVEIKQFRGDAGQILVPRVIGRMAATDGRATRGRSRVRQTVESLLDQFPDPQTRSAAERLIEAAQTHDRVTIGPGSKSISIRVDCDLWPQQTPLTVAWLYVEPGVNLWGGTLDFSFGTPDPQYGYDLDAALADRLDEWAHEFDHEPFAVALPNPASVRGHSISYVDAAENIDLLAERLTAVLGDLAAMRR